MNSLITKGLIQSAMSYSDYRGLLDRLLEQGNTTGQDQSESMIGYAQLNQKRMKKWDKIGKIKPELAQKLAGNGTQLIWLVLTEGWCGDAAQCLPFIEKMATLSSKIQLRLILRDEHLELMDAFLTNGGRGIPKLIVLDEALNVLGSWGPRPKPMQELMLENKKTEEKTYQELSEEMHLWYARDRGETIQDEFILALDQWTA